MPGYGYARASKDIKADWQGMMFDYLRGRPTLRRVMLLLDARIEMKQADHDVMDLLDRAAVTFQIVLTKTDGLKPPALARKIQEAEALARSHAAAFPRILSTSSETGDGIAALRAELASLADIAFRHPKIAIEIDFDRRIDPGFPPTRICFSVASTLEGKHHGQTHQHPPRLGAGRDRRGLLELAEMLLSDFFFDPDNEQVYKRELLGKPPAGTVGACWTGHDRAAGCDMRRADRGIADLTRFRIRDRPSGVHRDGGRRLELRERGASRSGSPEPVIRR